MMNIRTTLRQTMVHVSVEGCSHVMSLTLACFTGGVTSFALSVQRVKEIIRGASMKTLSGLSQQKVSFSTTETETAAS